MQSRGLSKTSGIFIILISLIFTINMVYALTISIDKPRMVLYKNMTIGQTLKFQESVIVNNVNDYEVNVKIQPKNDWKNKVSLINPEFKLPKGETKEVFYEVTITEKGYYKGDVLVTFSEADSKNKLSIAQELEVFVKEVESNIFQITGAMIKENKKLALGSISILFLILILIVLIKLMKNKK